MAVAENPTPHDDPGKAEKQNSSMVLDPEFENVVNEMMPKHDDPSIPSLTLRVWIIGVIACIALAAVNQIFLFRTNYFYVNSFVAILLAYPAGVFMARAIPRKIIKTPFGTIDTNPGPFSIKEHALIGIFAGTGAAGIYGSDNLIVQKVFYEMDVGPLWGIMFLFTTSTLGFGLSGICRKFLIRPAHMLWPSLLPQIALYSTFHPKQSGAMIRPGDKKDTLDEKDISAAEEESRKVDHAARQRLRFFYIAMAGAFIFAWIPGYIAPMLANLPLLCWITPKTATTIQQIGSPVWGVGVLSLSLDWTVFGNSGMTVPFWTSVNTFIASIVFMWILTPLASSGKWFGEVQDDMWNTSSLYTNQGERIHPRTLVDPITHKLDEAKYKTHAPIFITPFFAWCYFSSMATFTASISNMIVWHGSDIMRRFRASSMEDEEDDIHCKLIDKYPEVPNTWYFGFFGLTTVLSIVTCHASGIDMKWYYTILAIVVSIIGTIPIAIVLATSGAAFGLNVISEFIIGLMEPGAPILMMAFKCMGVTVCSQCLTLLADLKTGHYLKLPPRHVFIAQITSQIIAVFVCFFAQEAWINNETKAQWILDMGKKGGPGQAWGAQVVNVYFNASLLWGAIGPKRSFFESTYSGIIIWGLIIGAVTPFLIKACSKFIPGKFPWQLVNPVLLFSVATPGQATSVVLTTFILAFIFQFYLFRNAREWWTKYNYVLATALDVGVALTTLIVTLGLQDNGLSFPSWFLNPANEQINAGSIYGGYADWCHPTTE